MMVVITVSGERGRA